jgi:hypothetical protein
MSKRFSMNQFVEDYDGLDEPMFQPLRKQGGKAETIKDERRKAAKEFGKSIHKYHKERRRNGFEKP